MMLKRDSVKYQKDYEIHAIMIEKKEYDEKVIEFLDKYLSLRLLFGEYDGKKCVAYQGDFKLLKY